MKILREPKVVPVADASEPESAFFVQGARRRIAALGYHLDPGHAMGAEIVLGCVHQLTAQAETARVPGDGHQSDRTVAMTSEIARGPIIVNRDPHSVSPSVDAPPDPRRVQIVAAGCVEASIGIETAVAVTHA